MLEKNFTLGYCSHDPNFRKLLLIVQGEGVKSMVNNFVTNFVYKDSIGQKLFWNNCFMVQVHSVTALSSDPDSISGQEMCSPNLQ